MPKCSSVFLLLSVILLPSFINAGSFGGISVTEFKDMIMGRINDPNFKPSPVNVHAKGMDYNLLRAQFMIGSNGIHPKVQALQSLDLPKQTTFETVQNVVSYAQIGGAVAVALGQIIKGAADTVNGAADIQKSLHDMEEEQRRAAAPQSTPESATPAPAVTPEVRTRSLSSECREADLQMDTLSLEELRDLAHQEALNNSEERYFRNLHYLRLRFLLNAADSAGDK